MTRVSKQGKLQKKTKQVEKQIKQHKKIKELSYNDNVVFQFVEQYSFPVFLFLILLLLFVIFRDFITLKNVFLFKDIGSDTINIFFPSMYANYVAQGQELSYSFTSGMGQAMGSKPSFINQLPQYLINPLNLWNLFIDKDNVQFAFFFRQFFNILSAGIIFFFFLRVVKFSKYSSILGAILMSFSGYMIVGSVWVYETGRLVGLATVLLAFELWYMRKIWFVFPIVIAYIGSIGFFYFNAVFLTVYVLFRYFDEQDFELKNFFKYIGIVGGLTLLGLLVRLPSMYNEIITILNRPRVSGDISKVSQMQEISIFATGGFLHNITAIFRFFGNDLLGTGRINNQIIQGKQYLIADFKGYNNYYEAPMFYIGLLTLVLVPQSISLLSKKRKILYSVLILFWIFPVVFPYFRRAYFLFFGDYYRSFSLFLPFVLLFIALRAVSDIKRVNIPVLIGSFIALSFVLFYNWFDIETLQSMGLRTNPIKKNIRSIIMLFIVLYTGIFVAIKYLPAHKNSLLIVLLLVVASELVYMSNITINNRDIVSTREFNSKISYNDYTIEAVEYLKSIDKSFYRTEKDYQSGNAVHGSLNDAMVQAYFGTSRYLSFQGKAYTDFVLAFGIAQKGNEYSVRWSRGLRGRPLLQITANVKYHFSKSKQPEFLKFGYIPVKTFHDVNVLKNSMYLPFGFTYEKYINRSELDSLPQIAKEAVLLQAVVLDDSIAKTVGLKHLITNKNTYKNLTTDSVKVWRNRLAKDTLKINKWKQDSFIGTISLKKPKLLYFSILKDNNWKLQVNNEFKSMQTCNIGFSGIMLNAGDYEIKLYYDNKPSGIQQYHSVFLLIFTAVMLGLWFVMRKRKKISENDKLVTNA